MKLITITVETASGKRMINSIVNSLEDLQPALRAWNKIKQSEVQQRFDSGGPGWAPTLREKSSGKRGLGDALGDVGRVQAAADALLKRKLVRQLVRAKKRRDRGKGTAEAVERRYAVLKEFERMAAGGQASPFLDKDDRRLSKSVAGLRERQQRAVAKVSGRKLGKIANSIKSKLTKFDVTVYSTVPWSGIHNDGGTAGHGAKIPQRQFLAITDEDIALLARLIEEQVASAAE